MKSKNSISGFLLALGGALGLATGVANADITTEQRVSVQGVGIMAAGNMSGTTKTAISGNRSRTDSDLQLENKLVRMFARGAVGPTAEIVNLDADKLIHVNVAKKEYTEQSFEDLRARLQKGMDDASKSQDKSDQRQAPSAIDDSKCEWQDPRTDVRKTGEKGTFAGFDAERVVITAEQPCKDKQTGAICEIALTLDEWMAPKFATNEEVQKYRKAYAQKMGLDSMALGADSADRAKEMFSRYKGAWTQVAAKMKDIKGYPVKSSFSMAVGGDQCQSAQKNQQAQASDDSSAGSGSSPSDLAGKGLAKLGSLFHKKKDEAAPADSAQAAPTAAAAPPPATGPAGTMTLMTVTSEIVSVSTTSIPADSFDAPVGFKKVEAGGKGAT
jgi:hypothetical protein